MSMRKRKKSGDDSSFEFKKQRGLDDNIVSNTFNDWNTEISLITDRTQEVLSRRVEHIYEGIGRELESVVFEYTKGEKEFFLDFLKDNNIELNIKNIIDYLKNYKKIICKNINKDDAEDKKSIQKLNKQLIRCNSKLMSQNIIKDNEFIIKNWTYFLPILLSNAISDSELDIIIDKIPSVIRFIVKSIRKFQQNVRSDSVEDLETINLYKSILEKYREMNHLFMNINNTTINRKVIDIIDPLALYIKKVLKFVPLVKISSCFIPFKFEDNVNNLISNYKLDTSLLDKSNPLYLLYGSNITSLGVFGSNFLKKKMNLDNLWYLKIFTNRLKELKLSNRSEKSDMNDNVEADKLDRFIGTIGYGFNSFDSLSSMNPRPEFYKRENNNHLRWIIGKKVYKRYIKDMDPSKVKPFFCKTPLIIKNLFFEEDSKFGIKDYPKFPSIPNKEPQCNSINYFNNQSKKEQKYPLGFISSIKIDEQNKKELELTILDFKECCNYNKNSNLNAFKFSEYGLFWKNNQSPEELCTNFKLVPLRSCNASINYSIRFKSHLYYTRFLLEQIINSNWKKRLITRNKKYYKLSSLVNGGFLNKSQKEAVNKITKIITNNGLWENYCDIIPRILTGTDKKIDDKDLNDWEYFDEKNEFDKELSRFSNLSSNSNSILSLKFYKKYLKFNNKNYKLVSKKCQKMLAKYIFKEYPKFLTNYYKIRKEWKEFNSNENLKKTKQNVNNSSRIQLDIIGYSGEKNIKAQFSNYQNLNIKHDPDEINQKESQDPQVLHLIKMEKKQTNNCLTVLPKFDESLPINKIYKLSNFVSEDLFPTIKTEWNKNAINMNSECYNSFVKTLFRHLTNNSILNEKYKLFFLKIIHIINWLIYLLNNSNKSFGGSKAINKCLNSYFEKESNMNTKFQVYNKIPMEFCNWIIDNFMSKYQTENLQTRFSFSSTGESKLFATILWLSNYIISHCNNLNYNDYKSDDFAIPKYLPTEPIPIEFSDLIIEDLSDKFTKKFRTLSHALGFRSTTPPPRNFRSKNYSIPPNVTSIILKDYPRLSSN